MTICNITGCDMTARWKVGAKVWAAGFSKAETPPAELYTPLVVCDHHKANPYPAREFFTDIGRAQIDAEMLKLGKAVPDYESAEWSFTPLEAE